MRRFLVSLALLLGATAGATAGEFVVLVNRTPAKLACSLGDGDKPAKIQLEANEVKSLRIAGSTTLSYAVDGKRRTFQLDANAAYYFSQDKERRTSLAR